MFGKDLAKSVEIRLIADSCRSFTKYALEGLRADTARIGDLLNRSLMLVTALSPRIGYENAAKTAMKAHRDGTGLKEACVALGYLTGDEFDACFHPEEMV